MEDDLVKTCRLGHRFLIGVLGAGLLCLISPNESAQPYEDALVEIDKIRNLKSAVDEYDSAFRKQFDVTAADDVARISSALRLRGFEIDESSMKASDAIPYEFPKPPFGGVVSDFYKWFREQSHWSTTFVVINDSDIERLLSNEHPYDGISIPSRKTWRLLRDDQWLGEQPGDVHSFQETEFAVEVYGGTSAQFIPLGKASSPMGKVSSFSGWSYQHGYSSDLMKGDDWLPACRAVWPEIENHTLSSAERYLRELVDQNSGSFQLLGMSIASSTLAIVLPLFTASLQLFLIAHSIELSKCRWTTGVAWIGLHPNLVSKTIMWMSLIVSPVILCWWSAYESSTGVWVMLLTSGVLSILGYTAIRLISRASMITSSLPSAELSQHASTEGNSKRPHSRVDQPQSR